MDQVEDSIVQLDIQIRISLPICLDFNQSIFQDLLSIIVVKCLFAKNTRHTTIGNVINKHNIIDVVERRIESKI